MYRLRTMALVVVLATGLAACGSNSADKKPAASTDGATGLSDATAYLQSVSAIPTSINVDVPLSKKPDPGRTIISLNNPVPTGLAITDGMSQAAAKLGWTVKSITTGGTPETMQAAFQQAIDLKPDGITYSAIPAAVMSKQLEKAKAAGIPVIVTSSTDPASGPIIDNSISDPKQAAANGKAVASYIVSHSAGKANVLDVDLPAYPVLSNFGNAVVDNIKAWCSSCSVTKSAQQITDIGTKTPTSVVSELQRNPKIDWAAFVLGDLSTGVTPALKAASLADRVTFAGLSPTEEILKGLRDGGEGGWLASPLEVVGMRVIDSFARDFNGDDLSKVQGTLLPTAFVTSANVADINTDKYGQYAGPKDALDQFLKLWLVS